MSKDQHYVEGIEVGQQQKPHQYSIVHVPYKFKGQKILGWTAAKKRGGGGDYISVTHGGMIQIACQECVRADMKFSCGWMYEITNEYEQG